MTIPTYDAVMLPLLRHCAEREWHIRDLIARIADDFALSAEERAEMLPSGSSTMIGSRVGWARTYLKKAGLVDQPRRGVVRTTPRGRETLKENPSRIDVAYLKRFDDFRKFVDEGSGQRGRESVSPAAPAITAPTSTPHEQITAASRTIDDALRDLLLERILESHPRFFERLIIDLLLAMGYGGSRADAGHHLGGSGDGGVDGLIREDQLGLDRVYLQAKRYQPGSPVGPGAVQGFIGALVGKGAHKGVFITTSTFTKSALAAAHQSGALRIVLIDGAELTKLMVRFDVGVRTETVVQIKEIDHNYFNENVGE